MKNIYDFSVQVRNFLLPLILKVFRHKDREAQSFYSGFFICSPHLVRHPPQGLANKRKPTVFFRGNPQLNSLFSNSQILRALPVRDIIRTC